MDDEKSARKDDSPSASLVNHDVVQIEFVIDDLIKRLVRDNISPIASCNGCKGCKASVDL